MRISSTECRRIYFKVDRHSKSLDVIGLQQKLYCTTLHNFNVTYEMNIGYKLLMGLFYSIFYVKKNSLYLKLPKDNKMVKNHKTEFIVM